MAGPEMNTQARKSLPRAAPGSEFNDPRVVDYGEGDIWQPQQPGGQMSNVTPPADAIAERDRFLAGEGGAIPAGPAAVPKLKSIREYLQALQPGQTPMFTNRPDSPMGQDPNAMVFGEVGQGPGGPITPPGAIQEEPAGDPADEDIMGKNPYEMAAQRMEHLMPEIEAQVQAQYGNTLSTEEYDQKLREAVTKVGNQTIKRYEKKVADQEKFWNKHIEKHTGKSIKALLSGKGDLEKRVDRQAIAESSKSQWDKWEKESRGDPEFDKDSAGAKAMMEKFGTADEYIRQNIEMISNAIQEKLEDQTRKDAERRGGAVPEQGDAGQQITDEEKEIFNTARANNLSKEAAYAKVMEHRNR